MDDDEEDLSEARNPCTKFVHILIEILRHALWNCPLLCTYFPLQNTVILDAQVGKDEKDKNRKLMFAGKEKGINKPKAKAAKGNGDGAVISPLRSSVTAAGADEKSVEMTKISDGVHVEEADEEKDETQVSRLPVTHGMVQAEI